MLSDTTFQKDTTSAQKKVELKSVTIDNEIFFKISNSNLMRPFFMSIVSDSNHWMFISSNGGLTAGRKNAEYSLFPYYTDDKITESAEITGNKSIFKVHKDGQIFIWEPMSMRFQYKYNTTQNLYKNTYGNKIIFEEINHDLGVTFRYQWSSSNQFGFIKTSKLENNDNSAVKVELLDGIQNIVPAGIGSYEQNASSNLVDAYKRNELQASTGIGIYALSAILVDKAEAAEALRANIVWSVGLSNPKYLVSSLQLDNFRNLGSVAQETDVKAEKGAYFVNQELELAAGESKEWMIVADVNKNHSSIAKLSKRISDGEDLQQAVEERVEIGTKRLIDLNAASDAIQCTSDDLRDARHFSNTLFNIMRGGIFDNDYKIEKWDFEKYLANASKKVASSSSEHIAKLDDIFTISELLEVSNASSDLDFQRLCAEYLPLKFSRRHGDPSRPWNKFSINTKSEIDGSKILDYEGNWRDIFQNWEALAHSYPEFIEGMIHKFLNASTFDGYNPYRVTKGGFDWEIIEPDDPWSYIGYWGDHQIIYLLKFLEFIQDFQPGKLEELFSKNMFVYANVPYKINPYQELLKAPKDTIVFDEELDAKIRTDRAIFGADGALLRNQKDEIVRANFIEKILATSLAKISNFIPEGGIWMNTQRPEWNDANNALVGNGVSMVTLYYLRRFFNFFDTILAESSTDSIEVSKEINVFFTKSLNAFIDNKHLVNAAISDTDKKVILDALGEAGSEYRTTIYTTGFSGEKVSISMQDLISFVQVSNLFLEHAIRANKREDNLYHAYNLMTPKADGVSISYLNEMLEGQVAVLSSGYLSAKEALEALDALKSSKLFRPDQYSYLLYPNKELKGYLQRNTIAEDAVLSSELLSKMLQDGNVRIVEKDVNGEYHFNGNFKNASDVSAELNALSSSEYASLISKDREKVLQIFEDVFNHKAFTGRSGTFYGYEGLGSIYWHMVSKLLLAVEEVCLQAVHAGESAETVGRLLEHFYEINEGIGVHKSPELYGAFPTDPYSHTPFGKGAQQPGMTGQVKEDILSRFGELGVFIRSGELTFHPCLLRKTEFVQESKEFKYVDLHKERKSIQLEKDSLGFTICQIPVVYKISNQDGLEVSFTNGTKTAFNSLSINEEVSEQIFSRSGEVEKITAYVNESQLK